MTDDTGNVIEGGVFFAGVVQGRDIVVTLPPEIPPALAGLPRASPSFTGRARELAVLLDLLGRDAANPVLVGAVGGLGGIGKTELATQAARHALASGRFPGGVLFVDMLGYDPEPLNRLTAGRALGGFLRAMGVPDDHVPAATEDRSRLFRSLLAACAERGRRVLVVIDNVSDRRQVLPLLATDGATATIVTSREALAGLDARQLHLEPLPRDEAVDLLRRALALRHAGDTRIDDDPDAAVALTGLCAGLPLALQIVAALLAEHPARPVAAMVGDLSDVTTRLDEIAHPGRAVAAAFDLSYHRLAPDVARAFRLLSVNPGPDLSTPAAAALTDSSADAARRGLEVLARAHLVDPGAVYGRWRMHDLVRLHASRHGEREAVADGRDLAFTRLLDHYLGTARAANAHLDAKVADPAAHGFPDRATALDRLDAEYLNLVAATHAAAPGHAAVARDLPLALWDFLLLRRHFGDWVGLAGVAVTAARTLGDRRAEARASTDLGIAHAELGHFEEALDALRAAERIYRGIGDLGGTGIALNNLGNVLRYLRRFDEVVATTEAALEIARRAGDRRAEALALISLGLGLAEVRRFADAVEAHRRGERIYHGLGDRRGRAIALTNLGIALQEVGRLAEAVDAHEEAIALFRAVDERHGEASAYNNLGLALRDADRVGDSITAHETAIGMFRDLGDREGEGRGYDNLGLVLQAAGRFTEAVVAHRRDLAICRETGDRYGEGVALTNLGLALAGGGDLAEAADHHRAAVAVFREIGDEHGERSSLDNLEEALSGGGDG
ncbi:ATP-binding protein [Actinosynnema sp. NPDC004786]